MTSSAASAASRLSGPLEGLYAEFYIAACEGDPIGVSDFIDHGGDINVRGRHGSTAVMEACNDTNPGCLEPSEHSSQRRVRLMLVLEHLRVHRVTVYNRKV
eukprot:jgi/Tetstr1/444532/TSEL_032410.t1